MRITILTYGSRGDVQPYAALGVGLMRAGHTVTLAAPGPFESFVTGLGLGFALLAGDPAELSRGLVDRAGSSPAKIVTTIAGYVIPIALEVFDQMRTACADADLIIHSFLTATGGHQLAREKGIPDIFAQLYPMFIPTSTQPNLLAPTLPDSPFTTAYNRLTHTFYNHVFWQFNRVAYDWLRRRQPDLPAEIVWPFAAYYPHRPPTLFGFSPQVIAPAPEWGPDVHVTGFWFLDEDDWQPPAELVAFIDAGPPPVYIGFGSVVSAGMTQIAEVARAAAQKAGVRVVLLSGWGGLHNKGDNLLVIDSAPHRWLFPRMAAVVHHGGVGTTAAGLRAGVPSILVPFTSDQPFWGRTVERLGVGPQPIPRPLLDADRLAYALRIATTHAPIRDRAADLGAKIRAEDGVGQAVRVIEGVVSHR